MYVSPGSSTCLHCLRHCALRFCIARIITLVQYISMRLKHVTTQVDGPCHHSSKLRAYETVPWLSTSYSRQSTITTSCPNCRVLPIEQSYVIPTSLLQNRSLKCLGVYPRCRRVERSRRSLRRRAAARAGLFSRKRGTGVTWMELHIQPHAPLVHFRHTRGQPCHRRKATFERLHIDTLRLDFKFAKCRVVPTPAITDRPT